MTDGGETKKIGTWIPLESNPEVMNSWASKLGLSTKMNCFDDVYGLDPELLGMVPQPTKALLLIFPLSDRIEAARKEKDEHIAKNGQHKLDPSIIFIEQTIPNACGTIGLLHAIANTDVTLAPNSALATFIEEIQTLTPSERAKRLEETKLFSDAHVTAASLGQSAVPFDLDTDLHFVAFIQAASAEDEEEAEENNVGEYAAEEEGKASTPQKPSEDEEKIEHADEEEAAPKSRMRLVELDGRRAGPIDHGESKNFLHDVARIVRTEYIAHSASQNFGLVALGPPA